MSDFQAHAFITGLKLHAFAQQLERAGIPQRVAEYVVEECYRIGLQDCQAIWERAQAAENAA